MSLTNWLFGSMKRKNSDDKAVIATEVFEVGSEEGYTIIQAPTPGLYPQITPPSVTRLPYSVLPQTPQHSQYQTSPEMFDRSTSIHNQIEGVPFRLAQQLETHRINNKTELSAFKQVLERIQSDLKNNVYDYNFKTERNIMHESMSFNRIH